MEHYLGNRIECEGNAGDLVAIPYQGGNAQDNADLQKANQRIESDACGIDRNAEL